MRYPLLKSICHIDCRIISILRNDKLIRPQGSTIIEAGDEITFICATEHIKAVMSELQRLEKTYKRITDRWQREYYLRCGKTVRK